jgi:hypothetical protein
MEQKYFSVNEIIKHFKKKKHSLNFEDICGYVRKRSIHPVVYIDSVPTHAHETINVKQALAIGFCYLSAYWHISEDKIIALCDNLLRGQTVTTRAINKEELTQIRITSWMTQLHHFEGVPEGHIYPKLFSNDLAITGFIFPVQNPFSIFIGNIAISEEDLTTLTTIISETSETERNYENSGASPSSTNSIISLQKEKNAFFQADDVFTIIYKGETPIHLKSSIGLKQMEYMLKNPNKSFNPIFLMQQFNPSPADVVSSTENPFELEDQGIYEDEFYHSINDQVTDSQAIEDCKKRLSQIDEELTDAQELNDIDTIEKLKDEKDNILDYIGQSTNHRHQPHMSKNTSTKASDAVKKNINRALVKIEHKLPELHNHLLKCLKIGKDCVYIASDDQAWV